MAYTLALILIFFSNISFAQKIDSDKFNTSTYVFKKGDNLSSVLFRKGIGTPDSPWRLYGPEGLLNLNLEQNLHIEKWEDIAPGTKINLKLPATEKFSEHAPEGPSQEPKPPSPSMPAPESGYSAPLINLKTDGYLGLRYGISLVREKTLIKDLRIFSLFFESRAGLFKGTRFYWDIVPQVSDHIGNHDLKFGWQRFVIGRAFQFEPGFLFDRIHVTPKIGRYTLEAKLPRVDSDGETVTDDIRLVGILSFGYELDVEWVASWYEIRGWVGQDLAGAALGLKKKVSVYSKKYGLDLSIMGPDFNIGSKNFKLAWLFFGMNEILNLEGQDKFTAANGATNESDDLKIRLNTPYAGIGLKLGW